MTILDKSTAYDDDEAQIAPRNEKEAFYRGDLGVPPSYQDTVGAGTSASASGFTFPPPTNFTNIVERHGKITGSWAIDTSLLIPEALLRPVERNETERDNLSLDVTHGSIHADVALVSGTLDRASISLSVTHGKVHFRMVSRANSQPFKLKITNTHGETTVILPLDFQGPIRIKKHHHGKVDFSSTLQSRTMFFTEENAFVGDFRSTKFVSFESWQGDEVEVETWHSKVHLMYSSDRPISPQELAPPVPPKQTERLQKRGRGSFWGRRGRDRDCA